MQALRSPGGLASGARAGVTAFLKTLATEVAPDGITVNSAQPGLHATDRVQQLAAAGNLRKGIPTGTLGDPGDFGRVVTFLCSESAKFVTGLALTPILMRWRRARVAASVRVPAA